MIHGQRDITRESLLVGAACLVVAAIVAWLNFDNGIHSSIYDSHFLRLARYFRGEGDVEIFTYPVWGFPAVLALTHYTDFWTLTLHCLLASVALGFLYWNTAHLVRSRGLLVLLCVFALPWFSLASAKLADIWSASFGLLAILSLAQMLRKQSIGYAVLTGVLFGAACNFRSDYLAIALGLPLGVAVLAPGYLKPHVKHFALILIIVPLCVVPWGLYRMAQGASFGVTSTNGGMTLVTSLAFAGNRWGIVHSDTARVAEAKEALGPHVLPWSAQANTFFQERWRIAVAERPGEFIRKVSGNLLTTLKFGFYNVEFEPYLEADDAIQFGMLKEQLKLIVGSRANHIKIEKFRRAGFWHEDWSPSSTPGRIWTVAFVRLGFAALSAIFLVAVLVALARLALLDRARLREPLLLSCSLAIIYIWALIGLLQNEPQQSNVLYVLGIPLVVDLADHFLGGERKTSSGNRDEA